MPYNLGNNFPNHHSLFALLDEELQDGDKPIELVSSRGKRKNATQFIGREVTMLRQCHALCNLMKQFDMSLRAKVMNKVESDEKLRLF